MYTFRDFTLQTSSLSEDYITFVIHIKNGTQKKEIWASKNKLQASWPKPQLAPEASWKFLFRRGLQWFVPWKPVVHCMQQQKCISSCCGTLFHRAILQQSKFHSLKFCVGRTFTAIPLIIWGQCHNSVQNLWKYLVSFSPNSHGLMAAKSSIFFSLSASSLLCRRFQLLHCYFTASFGSEIEWSDRKCLRGSLVCLQQLSICTRHL